MTRGKVLALGVLSALALGLSAAPAAVAEQPLVERYRIGYHEKKLGQLFCDHTAQDIIAMLKAECGRGRVEWRMPCSVAGVAQVDGAFVISTSEGTVRASSLVVAG